MGERQRLQERGARVGGRRPEDRLDHRDAIVGKDDLEAVRPVVK